jgi:hypothetical protein
VSDDQLHHASGHDLASPFGMLSNPWPTLDPNQTPGFNVQPDMPSQTNPMASLLASLMPSGQDLKQGDDQMAAPIGNVVRGRASANQE